MNYKNHRGFCFFWCKKSRHLLMRCCSSCVSDCHAGKASPHHSSRPWTSIGYCGSNATLNKSHDRLAATVPAGLEAGLAMADWRKMIACERRTGVMTGTPGAVMKCDFHMNDWFGSWPVQMARGERKSPRPTPRRSTPSWRSAPDSQGAHTRTRAGLTVAPASITNLVMVP